MKKRFLDKYFSAYTNAEWIIIKITISSFWLYIIKITSINKDSVPFPSGFCTFFDCSALVSSYTLVLFFLTACLLTVLYILEKWMIFTTISMFLVSLILFTLEDSNGILNYNVLYSMTFFVQFIAYYRNNANLKSERIQFPIQIIAAGYTLAGISKLYESGLGWVAQAPQASIQMLKNYCYAYYDTGDNLYLDKGMQLTTYALEHANTIKTLFAVSLFLELFACLALINKKSAFIYGLLLTSMHIGIFYFMHIIIIPVFIPMLTFMVNPWGLVYWSLSVISSPRQVLPR